MRASSRMLRPRECEPLCKRVAFLQRRRASRSLARDRYDIEINLTFLPERAESSPPRNPRPLPEDTYAVFKKRQAPLVYLNPHVYVMYNRHDITIANLLSGNICSSGDMGDGEIKLRTSGRQDVNLF